MNVKVKVGTDGVGVVCAFAVSKQSMLEAAKIIMSVRVIVLLMPATQVILGCDSQLKGSCTDSLTKTSLHFLTKATKLN